MFIPDAVLAGPAADIIKKTNFAGGLIVHIGCGDGKLTAELHFNDTCLVHGLDADPDAVAKARAHIRKLGLYGKVAVETLEGDRLPYADNLVNLIVAEDLGRVPMIECLRVLAPKGAVLIGSGRKWEKTVKLWPDEIDEWTHHLHDAGGNAVARDQIAGPPAHLHWTAGPLWARSHGWTPSVSAMVSAAGRLFYICDETLSGAGESVPSKWFVVARDAFSGPSAEYCSGNTPYRSGARPSSAAHPTTEKA
jgi:SAM-dependent methyltransferase